MKKSFWGKALLGISALALGLVLTACGSNNSSDKSSNGGKVTITFWHGMTGPYGKALNGIIKDFNNSQDKYVVKGTAQGNYATLQQKIMAAAKSKKLPTIAQTTYTTVPDYVKNNFLAPLDPYMLKGSDKLSTASMDDIYPAFLSSSKYQGKYYSVPFSKSVRVLFYNKKLMDQLGVKMPTSWEEIAALGPQLKKKGIMAIGFDKSFDMEFEGLARQAGNALVEPDSLKVNVDSKETLTAAHFIWDMLQKGYAKTAGEDFYGDKAFQTGKTLFYVGSSAGVTNMNQTAPKSLDWHTAPLPTYNGQKATELAGNDLVMFNSGNDAQKKGAWAFMKFLLSKKETIKWAEGTGYVPLRKSAVEDPSFQDWLKKNPANAAAVNSLDFGFQSTAFVGFTEYRNDLLDAVDSMISKKTQPEKALADLKTKAEKIIKDNN
ncbi:ABC transporter substrate-binding protein [Lacticaseibacillus mingshuiensis]|uniref:ABC transporter substrate-binding protein n=1 Tax=Lacticaseibacillus mingshuiensis TaxID=2799574 RepID=A0ABW4CJF3_9LACO|nr:ABC transporter substrate-binding protein [Lacticaseibacillus mingshuiensis]